MGGKLLSCHAGRAGGVVWDGKDEKKRAAVRARLLPRHKGCDMM